MEQELMHLCTQFNILWNLIKHCDIVYSVWDDLFFVSILTGYRCLQWYNICVISGTVKESFQSDLK